MKLKFLKAGSGDSILISHNKKNILIDGGNDSTYLIEEYNKIIQSGENIDLLIITHHDDDHLKGILDLFNYILKKKDTPKISKVLFNSPRKIKGLIESTNSNKDLEASISSNFLSFKQAYQLEEMLSQFHHITWLASNSDNLDDYLSREFEDVSLKLYSPNDTELADYANNKGAYLNSDNRCDWQSSFYELNRHLDDKSQDISSSNRTSIVLYLIYQNKKILLTGDVTPGRFESIIDAIKGNEEKARFDLLKLPHHASYRSLNSAILKKIDCNKYIISTNGNKHYLPNKRALLKLINNNNDRPLEFLFNYGEVIPKLQIEKSELTKFKLKLIENNNEWGYGVNY